MFEKGVELALGFIGGRASLPRSGSVRFPDEPLVVQAMPIRIRRCARVEQGRLRAGRNPRPIGQDSSGQSFLKARVRAAPEDGKANAALEALIAKALGAPKSAVRVARGAKSRLKAIDVSGDPQDLLSRAQALLNSNGI